MDVGPEFRGCLMLKRMRVLYGVGYLMHIDELHRSTDRSIKADFRIPSFPFHLIISFFLEVSCAGPSTHALNSLLLFRQGFRAAVEVLLL